MSAYAAILTGSPGFSFLREAFDDSPIYLGPALFSVRAPSLFVSFIEFIWL